MRSVRFPPLPDRDPSAGRSRLPGEASGKGRQGDAGAPAFGIKGGQEGVGAVEARGGGWLVFKMRHTYQSDCRHVFSEGGGERAGGKSISTIRVG